MTDSPMIAAMGRTLVDRSVDLSNERVVILCLIGASYDARDIEAGLDLAVAFAQRIYDARQTLAFDDALQAVAAVMGSDHAP